MRRLKKPSICDGFRGLGPGCRHILAICVMMLIFCVSDLTVGATVSTDEVVEDVDNGTADDTDASLDGSDSVSDGDVAGQIETEDEMDASTSESESEAYNEILALLTEEESEVTIYTDKEEFLASPATITRYEYEILDRLEFLQYAETILIGLIFILIFKKK